jgi:hypothetical protein
MPLTWSGASLGCWTFSPEVIRLLAAAIERWIRAKSRRNLSAVELRF